MLEVYLNLKRTAFLPLKIGGATSNLNKNGHSTSCFFGDLLNQGSNGRRSGSFSSDMLFQVVFYFKPFAIFLRFIYICGVFLWNSTLIISFLSTLGETSSTTAPLERHGAFRNRAAEKEIRKELKLLLVLDNPFIIKSPWLQVKTNKSLPQKRAPGDSIRDLDWLIPDGCHLYSCLKGQVNSPSQKGHVQRKVEILLVTVSCRKKTTIFFSLLEWSQTAATFLDEFQLSKTMDLPTRTNYRGNFHGVPPMPPLINHHHQSRRWHWEGDGPLNAEVSWMVWGHL